MVTIQDVAKHAGVSVATVSHVLNKTRYVSPKLEEKVELSIRELGYEPIRKNAGRILKNQIVGVIIPDLSVDFYAVFQMKSLIYWKNMSLKWFYLIVVGTVVGRQKI